MIFLLSDAEAKRGGLVYIMVFRWPIVNGPLYFLSATNQIALHISQSLQVAHCSQKIGRKVEIYNTRSLIYLRVKQVENKNGSKEKLSTTMGVPNIIPDIRSFFRKG